MNECANIYSHEKLQYLFANLNYKDGINIHSDIEAVLSDQQRYTEALKSNPAVLALANITYAQHGMRKNSKDLNYAD